MFLGDELLLDRSGIRLLRFHLPAPLLDTLNIADGFGHLVEPNVPLEM